MKFENPALEINDVTYIPLREFCTQNRIRLDLKDYSNVSAWQGEEPPVSYIKLLMPYSQNPIAESTVSKYDQMLNPVFEKAVFVERKYQMKEKRITDSRKAVEVAAQKLSDFYGLDPYDTGIYYAQYLEKYDAWYINFNGPETFPFVCQPITEFYLSAIIDSYGDILYYAANGPSIYDN